MLHNVPHIACVVQTSSAWDGHTDRFVYRIVIQKLTRVFTVAVVVVVNIARQKMHANEHSDRQPRTPNEVNVARKEIVKLLSRGRTTISYTGRDSPCRRQHVKGAGQQWGEKRNRHTAEVREFRWLNEDRAQTFRGGDVHI